MSDTIRREDEEFEFDEGFYEDAPDVRRLEENAKWLRQQLDAVVPVSKENE